MFDEQYFSTTLSVSFDEAVSRTREAFAAQGFGILTEIDVTATLKNKIGADLEDFLILGACNPSFANRALQYSRTVGLMMPCNVVVRRDPGDSDNILVEAVNPAMMVAFVGEVDDEPGDSREGSGAADTELDQMASEAASRVAAAVQSLADAS